MLNGSYHHVQDHPKAFELKCMRGSDGSVTELVSVLGKKVTADEVNAAMKKYESPSFAYNDHDIVSTAVFNRNIKVYTN